MTPRSLTVCAAAPQSTAARWFKRAGPALAGLGLGLLALGPAVSPGFVLSYDMVFVPGPPISAATFGLAGGPPRAVPSDAVVALLSQVMPTDVVQKLILLLIFVLACSGAAALLDGIGRAPAASGGGAVTGAGAASRGGAVTRAAAASGGGAATGAGAAPGELARLAAGVFYIWNPFVAERLILGQWALLLGYAGLPWVLRSLCYGAERIRLGRLAAAFIPAAVGGFTAICLSALVAVPAALSRGGRPEEFRRLAVVLLVLVVASLPWLVPALLVPVHTDPNGADIFAARADTPFGRAGSLLMLGGGWNAETVPRGYGGAASAAWLVVAAVGAAGYVLRARPQGLCPGLGVAGLAGLALAAIGLTAQGRGVLRDLIGLWPGFAVLRDGQQYVAPLALVEAVGLGAVVAWLMRDLRAAAASAALALGLMATLAPVLLVPGLAWGAAGRLHSVRYPADWLRARRTIDGDRHPGAALVLPWAAYRRYSWNGAEAVFDPWSRMLHRRVIFNDGLRVGARTLAAEDPAARRLDPVIRSPGPLTRALRAAGVRYVIVDAGPLLAQGASHRAAQARLPGARILVASGDLVLYWLPPARPADGRGASSLRPASPIHPAAGKNGCHAGQNSGHAGQNSGVRVRMGQVTIRYRSGMLAGSRSSLVPRSCCSALWAYPCQVDGFTEGGSP